MKPVSRRFKIVVAYDGGGFAGWQSQAHQNTVQDRLEAALHSVTREHSTVHGSGRTDTGVHALGQCAHFDLVGSKWSSETLQKALNAVLSPAIRVLQCRVVSSNFHARFKIKKKTYRYRIWNAGVLSPFEVGRAWHISRPLDRVRLKSALSLCKGRHDFAAFSANTGRRIDDTFRTISRASLRGSGSCLAIEVEGEGFLYKMVRLLVGAAVLHAQGEVSLATIKSDLAEGRAHGRRLVAPACGLYLVRVRY